MSDDDFTSREKEVVEYWLEHIMGKKGDGLTMLGICPLCENNGIITDNVFFCICPNGIVRRKNFNERMGVIQ